MAPDGQTGEVETMAQAQVNRNGALIASWDMKEFQTTKANNGFLGQPCL